MGDAVLKLKQDQVIEEKRPRRKKTSNRYFYKVKNHHELFKIGKSFLDDYYKGVKCFAISSTGYQTSQQKSILGVASFFDHEEDVKIAIVSDNLVHGVFKEIIFAAQPGEISLVDNSVSCEAYHFYDHFDFINLDQLLQKGKQEQNENAATFDEIFDDIINRYDVIFWDVPELHKIQKESELYFPMIMRFDSLSIVVAPGTSDAKNIQVIRNFFQDYGINLKGLLFDYNPSAEDKFRDAQIDGAKIKEINKLQKIINFIRRILGHEKT